jgi:hypothetical protein
MRVHLWNRKLSFASATVVFLVLVLGVPSGDSAQATKPPVISLKKFISESTWHLDITWSANDTYEDADWSSKVEMTATAQYVLTQKDKRDDWGRWEAKSSKSEGITFNGYEVNKHDHSRTDYKTTSGPVLPGAGATFEVGGDTPGYRLNCGVAFPIKITFPRQGTMDHVVSLLTYDIYNGTPSGFCQGPLPNTGETIRGSLVVPMPIPPISNHRQVRVGVQFVLQPLAPLKPLVPRKKK